MHTNTKAYESPSLLMSMWEATQNTYHKANMGYSPENWGLRKSPADWSVPAPTPMTSRCETRGPRYPELT